MIGLGHPHIVVWHHKWVVCAGMVGLVALGEICVKNVVRSYGSILAWRDGLAGVGSPR